MQILGFTIARTKTLSSVQENRGGWYPLIRESYAGAWQQNVTVDQNLVLSYHAVFACMTLIASDISKMRVKLVRQETSGIWTEQTSPAYSPVLRRPNSFQNRIQFWENWVLSKLARGNVYVLKQRDNRNVVTRLYILDPARVRPLVSGSGEVYYELQTDNLTGIGQTVVVPAREIIHDRFNCLFHPLVGISPIYACGLAATQGIRIQTNSTNLFANGSRPGGILTAAGHIDDSTAARLKEHWDNRYTGENAGKVAVLGDGLKYEAMAITPEDAQLIEQLKLTAEIVCSTFHVPPYKLGIGNMPTNSNVESLNLEYYSQCLQSLIEAAELCLDEGLEVTDGYGTEFDIDGLLRMDTVNHISALKEAVSAGIMKPDEARRKLDLGPVEGGDTPYLQQQNFSLAALAKRDASDDPFAAKGGAPAAPALPEPPEDDAAAKAMAQRAMADEFEDCLEEEMGV
jgi:HK97 family phage portal protein